MLNREQIKLGMTVYGISYMPGRLTWNGSYKNFVNFIGQVVSFGHDTVVVQCENPDHHGYVEKVGIICVFATQIGEFDSLQPHIEVFNNIEGQNIALIDWKHQCDPN